MWRGEGRGGGGRNRWGVGTAAPALRPVFDQVGCGERRDLPTGSSGTPSLPRRPQAVPAPCLGRSTGPRRGVRTPVRPLSLPSSVRRGWELTPAHVMPAPPQKPPPGRSETGFAPRREPLVQLELPGGPGAVGPHLEL